MYLYMYMYIPLKHVCVLYMLLADEQGITSSTVPTPIRSRKMTRRECEALDCESARFGYSVQRLGDIDLDGYEGTHATRT